MHVVAVVVVSGTGSATTTAVVKLALAAGTGVGLGAELLEHIRIRPNFVERRVVHVARFFHHVGAGANLADRAYDTVVKARKATTAVTRLDVELVCNAQELRGASRLDRNSERAALFHNLAEKSFVFGNAERMTFDFLATAHRDEEEDLVVHGTDFLDPVHDVEDFVLVPVHDSRMDLEREARRLAIFDTHQREFKGIRESAEIIMTLGIDAIDANAHRHGASFLELNREVVRDERAVRAKYRAESAFTGMGHKFHDIRARHRLATAKNHDLESGLRNLVDELERF